MRGLFRSFRGRSYSHREFLDTIRRETGVDASRLFARYVEGREAPPEALVRDNLRRAQSLGVFRSEVTPPASR